MAAPLKRRGVAMSTPEDQIPDDAEDLETSDELDLIEEEVLDEDIEPDDIDDSP